VSGAVGVIASDSARFTAFSMCLTRLHTPVNTAVLWGVGSDRSIGRNNVVRAALDQGAEWLLFVDDDMAFPQDILMRLLAWDQPIVASLYVGRMAPHYPIAYTQIVEVEGVEVYVPVDLTRTPTTGLVEVVGAGTGGMLIRSEVFHALERDYGHEWFTHTTAKSEDLMFCDRAIAAGFPVHLDLEARMGHIAPSVVWPVGAGGEWQIGFVFSENTKLPVRVADLAAAIREQEDRP
jgi:hypothetical protein